jgi:uncharacterized membrane protein YdbT with pleckstrin-like domain
VPARSSQRSSQKISASRGPSQGRAPEPRQELVDALAEADLALKRAQLRELEARTAADARRGDAEVELIEAQQEKVAGEIAERPQQARERQLRIERSEADLIRTWTLILVPLLLVALVTISGSFETTRLPWDGAGQFEHWLEVLKR